MDIRWQQRFVNYKKALKKLLEVVSKCNEGQLSELETEGMIQRFEYTFELSWKTLQDLLKHKGYDDIAGPNATLTQALIDGFITDADGWRRMKKSRELTSHTYEEETASAIANDIVELYSDLLNDLALRLEKELSRSQLGLFDELES